MMWKHAPVAVPAKAPVEVLDALLTCTCMSFVGHRSTHRGWFIIHVIHPSHRLNMSALVNMFIFTFGVRINIGTAIQTMFSVITLTSAASSE